MKRTAFILICTAAILLGAASNGAAEQAQVDEYSEAAPSGDPVTRSSVKGVQGAATPGTRPDRDRYGGRNGGKRPLTGFGDFGFQLISDAERRQWLGEIDQVKAKVVRLEVFWSSIAPSQPSPVFNAADPASPEYAWGSLDDSVSSSSARGKRVILMIREAPRWAEGANRPSSASKGTWKPSPRDLADFATAVAKRYSGSFGSLPRVRDFMLWNEPNLETNLTPVWKGKNGTKPASPLHYAKMLDRFYPAIKAVSKNNRVITAGTAPYGADPGVLNMRPLLFWRELLCLKDNKRLAKTNKCKTKPRFDIAAHHPINTSGGPNRSAIHDDDVSTPDFHNFVEVIRAAEKRKTVRPTSKKPRETWVTELWWESNPPDPASVNPSTRRQARWYTESMYSLWRQGASMVLLLQLRDTPYDGEPGRFTTYQTGVYFADGKAKPAAKAMRFPFVADRKNKKKVKLWGIPPVSGKVVIERRKGDGFKRVKKIKRARAGKVFNEKVKLRGKQKLRARMAGERSMLWKLSRR